VGHWEILGTMARRAGEREVGELVGWALPIQERHLADVRRSGVELAGQEDPREPA